MEAITWPNSPTTEAIARVLETFLPDKITFKRPRDGKEYLILSYREDFDFLWKLEDALLNWLQDGRRTIILVWDETPKGAGILSGDIRDYVTAFDWAVALSLTDEIRRRGVSDRPLWRLVILDLGSWAHANSQTVQLFRRFQQGSRSMIPQVKILNPTEIFGKRGSRNLWQALNVKGPSEQVERIVEDKGERLDSRLLKHLWVSSLSRPGDRHTISNIVGPLLLLAGMNSKATEIDDPLLRALIALMSAVGLIPEKAARKPAPWGNWEHVSEFDGVEFILIDDQYRDGWGQFICTALGAEFHESSKEELSIIGTKNGGKVQISACTSAEFLLDQIERLSARERDQRFQFRIGTGQCSKEILFLDLRLFSGLSLKEEADFLSRLVAIAKSRFRHHESLPWPGFSDDELTRIDDWLQNAREGTGGNREDEIYLEALTLLPRVLSLTDLSLPIVIFSSAGQRVIAENLKDYGNVITRFEKPRFFGYESSDFLAKAYAGFMTAMEEAISLLSARRISVNLLSYVQKHRPVGRGRWSQARHFELYIDESGKSSVASDPNSREIEARRFVVAGLLVPYTNTGEPLDLHREMELRGLRWWPQDLTSAYVVKRQPLDEFLDLPGAIAKDRDHIMDEFIRCVGRGNALGVSVEYKGTSGSSELDDLQSQSRSDNRYRLMLSALLELVLFELLPEITGKRQATLSIFVATRVRSSKEYKDGTTAIKLMKELWGYQGPDNNEYLRSLDESAVLQLVFEVLSRHPSTRIPVKIEHARGVALAYPTFKVTPKRDRGWRVAEGTYIHIDKKTASPVILQRRPSWIKARHQHYVADLIANGCYEHGFEIHQKWPWERIFAIGMYDNFDAELASLMVGNRALGRGEMTTALISLKNFNWSKARESNSGALLILRRIAAAIKERMNGTEYIAFARALEKPETLGPVPLATKIETGRILEVNYDRNFGFIITDKVGNNLFFSLNVWLSATYPENGETVAFERAKIDGRERAKWVRSAV